MTDATIARKTAIAGIGATEFSRNSGRSEIQLAIEAVSAALADAGIDPAEVDGMSTYSMDNNMEVEIHRLIGGRQLNFFSRTEYGGGAACAPVLQGAMAITSGVADVVVIYRAMNERSGVRFGQANVLPQHPNNFMSVQLGWYMVYGLMTPASWVAMVGQRMMYESGATSEDLGRVSVAARDFAATNPAAFFYRQPITLDDHQNSRFIVEPLRLLDCCQESDGACAMVMVSAERAKHLDKPVVLVEAAAQGAGDDQQMMTSYYRKDLTRLSEMEIVAQRLYRLSGLEPAHFQTAVLYDHFTPFVLPQLEAFGFCERGGAKEFVRDGQHARNGESPINTHGGQLGEAYIHGMNGILEGVRQVRGESVNQVDDVEHVLVTGGTGVPTSGLILGAEG